MTNTAAPKVKATKPKAEAKHPPFADMVAEAIKTLKDRSGSSLAAIKKAVESKYGKDLPAHWDKVGLSITVVELQSIICSIRCTACQWLTIPIPDSSAALHLCRWSLSPSRRWLPLASLCVSRHPSSWVRL